MSTTDETIGIVAIKALAAACGQCSLSDGIAALLELDTEQLQRVVVAVGSAAREAVADG